MDYVHPTVRATTIANNLHDAASFLLLKLYQEVNTSVPSARMTKTADAIIIPSADNKRQLIVTIPITGDNSTTLCASMLSGEMTPIQMSWTVFTAPNNGIIVCTAKPELFPVSASKIISWYRC